MSWVSSFQPDIDAVLYGTLSGIFFFLLWAYYASMAFIISATIASVVKRGK